MIFNYLKHKYKRIYKNDKSCVRVMDFFPSILKFFSNYAQMFYCLKLA